MKVGKIMLGMCQTNCYYLYEEGSKETVFVEPICMSRCRRQDFRSSVFY
jgi:hypothetical protein